MDSALIGAVTTLIAVSIGAFLNARREQRLWLRKEKQAIYVGFLRVATPKFKGSVLLPRPGVLSQGIEDASYDLDLIASLEVKEVVSNILNDLEVGMEHGMDAGTINHQHSLNLSHLVDAMRRDVGSKQWIELLSAANQTRLRSISPYRYRG